MLVDVEEQAGSSPLGEKLSVHARTGFGPSWLASKELPPDCVQMGTFGCMQAYKITN